MSDELREAAEIRNGMHVILDDGKVWRVMGVKRHPGAREFFLSREGDVSRTTRKDTDLIRCVTPEA